MSTIDITHRVFERHIAAGRPTPAIISKSRRSYQVDLEDPNMDALFETVAEIYLGYGLDMRNHDDQGIKRSATRLIGPLKQALFGDGTVE